MAGIDDTTTAEEAERNLDDSGADQDGRHWMAHDRSRYPVGHLAAAVATKRDGAWTPLIVAAAAFLLVEFGPRLVPALPGSVIGLLGGTLPLRM